MSNFLINALIPLVPCAVLYVLWGKRALLLMIPAVLYLVVFIIAQLLPGSFAPFPKGSAGSETCFRVMSGSVILLLILHVWFLWSKNYSITPIAVAEILQIPAWFYMWYVVGVSLQGGK